jgi:hypothetical protein
MLAKARPDWEFVGSKYRTEYKVWHGNTYLGVINFALHNDRYRIDCESLSAVRQRGDFTKTKNVKKACEIILTNFKVKSNLVLAREKHLLAGNLRMNLRDTANMRYKSRMTYLTPIMSDLMFSDIDYYTITLMRLGAKLEQIEAAKEAREEICKWDSFFEENTHATPVVVVDGVYYMANDTQYTDDTLPHYLRQNLGLLKLMGVGSSLTGVGFVAGSDMFLVVPTRESDT